MNELIERLKRERVSLVRMRESQKKHKDRAGWKNLGFYVGRIYQIDSILREAGEPIPEDPGQDISEE